MSLYDSSAQTQDAPRAWEPSPLLGEASTEHEDGDMARPDRPANAARSLFHVASGLVSLFFTLVLFTPRELPFAAGAFAVTFWFLESLRRPFPRFNAVLMKVFAPIAHPSESHRINSATWYMTALTLLALTQDTMLCVVGVTVLGFADPAASFVGRRWGRIELLRGRTLEGTLAFVAVGTLMTTLALQLVDPRPGVGFSLLIAFVASLTGGIAEVLSRRIDDNLSIPLVAAATAATVLLFAT